jgi:hypothetical protein
MASDPEVHFPKDYRTARKAFIAACEKAQADTIARVHPAIRGADGKPLFLDSVALGPRPARKALLLIADGAEASAAMTALLQARIVLPDDTRLVLVHAFNPFTFAGVHSGDRDWSLAMLGAVATEDLARVTVLKVLAVNVDDKGLAAILRQRLPAAKLAVKRMILAQGAAKLDARRLSAAAIELLAKL